MPLRRRGRQVRQVELSGVPCLWADAAGPFTAMLVFRVGRADETLATAGVTHLAEHLVMPTARPREYNRNARVENLFTSFWASGGRDNVLGFIETTAAAIADPPLERLDVERRILLTEAATGGSGPVAAAMALRFGAGGHGLVGHDELGLASLDGDAAAHWIERSFTLENAALWMSGRPPSRLDLPLPHGKRIPPPEPQPLAELETPACFAMGPFGVVHASLVARRGAALSTGFQIAVERAWQTLRWELGHVYEISDWFDPLDRDWAELDLGVEALEQNVHDVRTRLLELLGRLATEGPTSAELAAETTSARKALDDPETLPGFLNYSACEATLGAEFRSEEQLVGDREALEPPDVAEALEAALGSLLLVLPPDVDPPAGFAEYPLSSTAPVEGRAHRPLALPVRRWARRTRLVAGDDGVAYEGADGMRLAVRFEDCVALQRWADGSRTTWARDGFRVHVDPGDWVGGKGVVRLLDERVPAELVVDAEPEEMARADEVEQLATDKLKRRWVVSEELARLPTELQPGESVLTLAEANRGWRPGLLVLTDRRLLWLYATAAERTIAHAYEVIDGAEVKRGVLECTVEVVAGGETTAFPDIVPKERAAEIAELIAERASPASPSAPDDA